MAGLAGYVDVTGYIQLRGYFASFMTGPLERTGQLIADRLRGDAFARPWLFAWLWASLLLGALGGALVAFRLPAWSLWPATLGAILLWRRARTLQATAP